MADAQRAQGGHGSLSQLFPQRGLAHYRYRELSGAQYVGCVLRGDPAVESEPGEGARVTIALPLAAHKNVDAKNANGAESIRAVA
jgi:hypothetical protein